MNIGVKNTRVKGDYNNIYHNVAYILLDSLTPYVCKLIHSTYKPKNVNYRKAYKNRIYICVSIYNNNVKQFDGHVRYSTVDAQYNAFSYVHLYIYIKLLYNFEQQKIGQLKRVKNRRKYNLLGFSGLVIIMVICCINIYITLQ